MEKKYTYGLWALAGVSLALFFWWLLIDPTSQFAASIPGEDNRGADSASVSEAVAIGANFELFGTAVSTSKASWTQFRGADKDNIVKGSQPLKDSWSGNQPEILWSVNLGEGHAGPAVYEGKVYVMDYDENKREDALRCFSLEDGKELWRRSYNVSLKRNHGMSRTVPAVTADYVLTIGPRCHVMAVTRGTGDFLWGIDMVQQYKSEVPLWFTGQCPLIDNNKAILAPAGTALLIAVDMATGKVLWETPNPANLKMSHSSVMPWTFNGKKMYVYSAVGGVVGISAEGEDEGKILWQSTAWNHAVVAPAPVCFPDGKVFLTAGYGAGSMMIKVTPSGAEYKVDVLKEFAPKDGMACEQQTPVIWDGMMYGIQPKDAGPLRNQLVCVSPDDVTKIVWTSGKEGRFGLGPYLIADNKMFLLSDDGTLTMIKPDSKKYVQIAQKKLFDGHDAWAPMALVDGRLLLRDANILYCVNVSQ
ncbi:MAG TPA: PQQ-binding-like beta-propeller repeat protein [Prolixibacteraceae bacterium]|nr:PQQ-binding-like beta-propeller repeat protein [Prolixibacteraceae bacterium]